MTEPAAKRLTAALDDIIRLADTAARLVARGKDAFDSDEAIRLAAEAVLHKIGEAITRLPDDFLAANPDGAWRSMKATRNIVAHKYDRVDYEIIWTAMVRRLPAEAERIRQILDRLD